MNVFAFLKSFKHDRILRDMCEEPQLELRVIRGNDFVSLLRHERAANTPAKIGANRNVLQIGIAGRKPAGGRNSLIELAVNAPVCGYLVR